MAAGNKIPLWAFGFLYWSLHLTHSLKEQALIQERTQCRPKGLRGPTTGGLNHLRNLSHHYLWKTNHNAGSSVLKVGTVLKTLKAGPARASSLFVPGAGMENNQFHLFQRIEECRLIFEMPRAGAYKLTWNLSWQPSFEIWVWGASEPSTVPRATLDSQRTNLSAVGIVVETRSTKWGLASEHHCLTNQNCQLYHVLLRKNRNNRL